jgi:hypothetical protein
MASGDAITFTTVCEPVFEVWYGSFPLSITESLLGHEHQGVTDVCGC